MITVVVVAIDSCQFPQSCSGCFPAGFVSSALGAIHFLIEGESECTSERARGQFSIFGAVEENACHGFSRIGTDQEPLQRYGCKPLGGLGFGLRDCVSGEIWRTASADCAQGTHRKCRKAAASCQRPDASSPAWLRQPMRPSPHEFEKTRLAGAGRILRGLWAAGGMEGSIGYEDARC
jgi:hypothetical protein